MQNLPFLCFFQGGLILLQMTVFKKCYKKNDLDLIANYKKYCNKLTTIKRIAKQNYYASMIQINKKDLSKQWQLINQILHRNNKHRPTIEKLLTENNEFNKRQRNW